METYRPTPEEAKPQGDPRIDAAMQLVEAGIDRLMDSDEFKRFLEFQGRFHKYSPNNAMLIWMQKPDATRVMGYGSKDGKTGWKSVGRQVRAGEKAIKIFAPMVRKEVDVATGELVEKVRGFKIVNVFDASQTDGEPLPERPGLEILDRSTERGHRLYNWTADYLADNGIPVFRKPVPHSDSALGSYHPGESPKIYVRPDLSDDMAAKTLIHETSHWKADHRIGEDKRDIEPVAELSAFVVCNRFDLDTAGYSFGYAAAWCEDRDRIKANLGTIQQVSKTIINGIEGIAQRETSVDAFHVPFSTTSLTEGIPQRLPSPDELRQRYD